MKNIDNVTLTKAFKHLFLFICLVQMLFTVPSSALASVGYFNESELNAVNGNKPYVDINRSQFGYNVRSFGQGLLNWPAERLKTSTCGYCCAATVVRVCGSKHNYSSRTPMDIYHRIKTLTGSQPDNLGVRGMAHIFSYYGVNYKLVRRYPASKQKARIQKYLDNCGMVVCWTKKPGLGNAAYHSIVLCGYTNPSWIVLVANSAIGKNRYAVYSLDTLWEKHIKPAEKTSTNNPKLVFTSASELEEYLSMNTDDPMDIGEDQTSAFFLIS